MDLCWGSLAPAFAVTAHGGVVMPTLLTWLVALLTLLAAAPVSAATPDAIELICDADRSAAALEES